MFSSQERKLTAARLKDRHPHAAHSALFSANTVDQSGMEAINTVRILPFSVCLVNFSQKGLSHRSLEEETLFFHTGMDI